MALRLPFRLPQPGPRIRKVLQIVGMFVLAIVTFVFAFQLVFPYDRARDRIEELASSKVDLTIDKVKRSWIPGRFYLENVTMKTRPSKEELDKAMLITDAKEREKAIAQLSSTVFVDEIMVDIGLIGFIKGTASVDFVAKLDDGKISGNLSVSKGATSIKITGSDVPSQRLPMREVLSNLPMAGDINFDFDLDLPNEKLKSGKTGPDWTKSTGSLEFECPANCTIGDGKAKLKLKASNERSQAFAGEGTNFGKLEIQSLLAKVDLKDGKMDITKFDTKSNDVELYLDYTMTLAQQLEQSAVLGCIRFKATEALRKRERTTYDQVQNLTGAARQSDGTNHIKLEGTFKQLKKLAKVCGPGTNGSGKDIDSPTIPSRPTMAVHPDEPVRTTPPPINPPPPPTPAPTVPVDAGVVPAAPPDAHAPTPTGGDHPGSDTAAPAPEGAGSGSG